LSPTLNTLLRILNERSGVPLAPLFPLLLAHRRSPLAADKNSAAMDLPTNGAARNNECRWYLFSASNSIELIHE
jgi:hypothetical protein